MKKMISVLLVLTLVLSMAACGGNTTPDTSSKNGNEQASEDTTKTTDGEKATEGTTADNKSGGDSLAGTYDITVWVADAATGLTKKQIDDFNAKNEDGIVFNATVEPVSESDSATQMITDVEAGGDLYCFAQDQFARLVQAGALAKLGTAASKTVSEANDPTVVAAATSGDVLYAYPMTADNGYFMYYDKSVIPEEDVDSLEALIKDCEDAGKYFSFEMGTSAWYLASFFFGTGCVSEWTTDDDGKFVKVNDDFNSAKGLAAVKGMKKLVDSDYHLSASAGDGFASNCAIVVSGTWDFETVKSILGDNMGVADLPSFEVDGKEYHLGSYSGCKLMGVKPQTDAYKAAALHKLAQYLTGEEGQMERFEALSWGPSNLEAQKSDEVQANPGLVALQEQSPYSVPQGNIHGSWWDIAKVIGDDVKAATSDEDLQKALDSYEEKINALFSLDGYIFVGAWNGWSNSDGNFAMKDNGDGTMSITVDVEQSDYMGGRIVTAGDWDTDKGCAQVTTGKELISEDGGSDNNIVFLAPGTYTVTWNTTSNEITIVQE